MNYKKSFNSSFKTSLTILKLIIPIFIIADILFYYNIFSHIAFLVEPFTSIIGLPPETSLALLSGMFLNVYGAIAFAAPLELSVHQWSIMAVFIGINHALIVEGVIMKKLGISNLYSYSLRIISAFIIGYITAIMPSKWFSYSALTTNIFEQKIYNSFFDLLQSSIINASILSFKVIILISLLIFIMDYIKSTKYIQNSKKNVSKGFSLGVGYILGITYGAGILINEAKSSSMNKEDIFYVSTFLMIAHAVIEDTLLFVIFGADFTMVIIIRTIAAIIIAYILLQVYKFRKIKYID
jgi:hypothetical protein